MDCLIWDILNGQFTLKLFWYVLSKEKSNCFSSSVYLHTQTYKTWPHIVQKPNFCKYDNTANFTVCIIYLSIFFRIYYKRITFIQFKMVTLPCIFAQVLFSWKQSNATKNRNKNCTKKVVPVWQRLPPAQDYHIYTAPLVRHAHRNWQIKSKRKWYHFTSCRSA
jgi:hypothetical protein